jgi:hypothetical protein
MGKLATTIAAVAIQVSLIPRDVLDFPKMEPPDRVCAALPSATSGTSSTRAGQYFDFELLQKSRNSGTW